MPTPRPLLALAALLVACTTTGTTTSGGTCKDRVAEFRAAFAGLPQVVLDQPGLDIRLDPWGPGHEANLATPPTRPIDLPRSRDGAPVERGLTLVVRADGTILDRDGAPAESPESVVGALDLSLKYDAPPGREEPILLALEAGAPLRVVAPLLRLLADPRTLADGSSAPPLASTVQLLTAPPDYKPPNEADLPAWMKTRVETMRAKLQSDMAARILDPLKVDVECPAVQAALTSADELAGGQRFLSAVRGLPPAIEACACDRVDVEGLAAWLWLRHEPWHPPVRGHAWNLGDATAEVVQLPATATAADLVPLIDARAGKPFRVALAPG